jgi:hypothetical protein
MDSASQTPIESVGSPSLDASATPPATADPETRLPAQEDASNNQSKPPSTVPPPAAPPPVKIKKKRGPKPKPLELRAVAAKPLKRRERTYSREQKIRVLTFLIQHKVERTEAREIRRRMGSRDSDAVLKTDFSRYRDVTLQETSDFFKIPTSTIASWWNKRDDIMKNSTSTATK